MTGRSSFLNERPPLDAKTRENVARIAERAWRSGSRRAASFLRASVFSIATIWVPTAHAQLTQVPSAAQEKQTVGEPESSPPENPAPPTPGTSARTGEKPPGNTQAGADAQDGADADQVNSAPPTVPTAGDAPAVQDTADRPPQPPAGPSDPLLAPTISLGSEAAPQASIRQRPSADPTATAASTAKECVPAVDAKHKFTSMVLLEGVGRYGGFVEGPDLEDDSAPTQSYRGFGLGAQATLGFIPGGRTFMMAGRLQGGAYLGSDVTSGTIGAAVLFGANLARKATGRTFSYVLGGFGVEYIPQKKQDILTLHISGGTVVRGLDFGADIDLGGNDEFARFLLGMHFGWGRLL